MVRVRQAGALLLFLAAIVVGFVGAGGLPADRPRRQHSPEPVYDCWNRSGCVRTTINTTITDCGEWYPGTPGGPRCERTTAGLDGIALVADPANHVPGPVELVDRSTVMTDPLLRQPWDMEFTGTGRMYITLNNGTLVRGRPGSLESVGSIDVIQQQMGGLLGLALDPRFRQNRYLYLFYSYSWHPEFGRDAFLNRISRFRVTEKGLMNETVLIDAIPGGRFMDGGRLAFGPEGLLYATTGKAVSYHASRQYNLPQDRSSLSGKILRIHPNGSVPATNPFPTSPVYSLGHKNPSGLAWHPESKALYATEHGPWRHDEVNRIVNGGNYGFPQHVCSMEREEWMGTAPVSLPVMRPPVWCAQNWTMAPGGAAFVSDPESPWYGDLLVTGLRGKHVRRLDFEDGHVVNDSIIWFRRGPGPAPSQRLRDIEYRNGSVWVVGDDRGIVRLTP